MAQVIIYNDRRIVRRWDNFAGATMPNPWLYDVGSYLRHKSAPQNQANWYTRKTANYGWEPIPESDVPKVYRLLTLLE